jgi:transglutaminase-like putative cysteine protease
MALNLGSEILQGNKRPLVLIRSGGLRARSKRQLTTCNTKTRKLSSTSYCTGYITDIGLPPPYPPMDFAAWIEVYLGDRWYAFDPRNNAPRIGRILIAQGRDAADVPLTHTFGLATLSGFRV